MKTILRFFKDLYSGPFQATLVFAFTAVAAITIGVGAWVTANTIDNYLATEMDERVARDIRLATTFYDTKLREVEGIADRLSFDSVVISNLSAARQGDVLALHSIQAEILHEAGGLSLGGSHFVAILDASGNVLCGYRIAVSGEQIPIVSGGNWSALPIVRAAMNEGKAISSTEIIPVEFLAEGGLTEQARIELIDTPKAALQPFDPREGSAGLAITAAIPILDAGDQLIGLALAFHMFNNDFTLVDQIKDTTGIDTVTVFLGDLRVSTNVMTADGQRAVGTRLAEDVSNVVLYTGQPYIGTAFVVNENYITRYDPLLDHTGQVVGVLYVGSRQASFLRLINTFDARISVIAILTILMTFILATPVSRVITRSLKELRALAQTSRRVAEGDLNVRALLSARGEVGQLAADFNNMLDTLQATQDQLVHTKNLAAIGQLAAAVAHELNNPLGTVLLYADTLLRESAPHARRRSDLEVIVREVQRCKSTIAALLDFARQQQIVAQDVDLNELILSILEVEKVHPRYRGVDFVTELDPNLPRIQADPAQLRAVFLNLLTNAEEAMPGGGKLTLRTRGSPDMVTISVADTGAGIPPENLGKIFTPFFTTKPIGKGTGLGLAITYGIVKLHRGQIDVKSRLGEGTTFTVSLPRRIPGFGGNAANQSAQSGAGPLTGQEEQSDEPKNEDTRH